MDVPTKTTVASPDEVKDFLHLPVQTADKRVNVKEENTEEISKLDIDAEMGKEQLKRLIEDNKPARPLAIGSSRQPCYGCSSY